jgi:hypothetical protein
MAGDLRICVERDRGQRRLYSEKIDLRNKWVDMIFHILPKASKKIPKDFKDGILQVWLNGHQIIDYQGALGFLDDEEDIYFKLGLYRDHMQIPMRIIYDRFRRGSRFEEVSLSSQLITQVAPSTASKWRFYRFSGFAWNTPFT